MVVIVGKKKKVQQQGHYMSDPQLLLIFLAGALLSDSRFLMLILGQLLMNAMFLGNSKAAIVFIELARWAKKL